MSNTDNNSMLKLLGSFLFGIIGLWLIYALLFNTGNGINVGFYGGYEGGHVHMGAGGAMGYGMGTGVGYGTAGTISVLLLFLIKVLFVLLIVGLVVGIGIFIKNALFTEEDIQQIKGTFTGKRTEACRETCVICGRELNPEWKICPYCGKEKETKTD